MIGRRRIPCVVAGLLIFGVMLPRPAMLRAQAIGNPSAANGWSTASAVQVYSHSGEAADRQIVNMINGTGISGSGGQYNAGGTPIGYMSLFRNLKPDGSPNNSYFGRAQPGTALGSHWVEFKFDQVYTMGTTWVWNWNETPYHTFGWKHIAVEYSIDNNTWHSAFAGTIADAPGVSDSLPQLIFTFPQGAQAQYVVLTNTGFMAEQNWGAAQQFNDYVDAGLSEIRFFPAGAVVPALSPSDFNNNGSIGLDDYAILKAHFLQNVNDPSLGDLNNDGLVDLVDFVQFKQDYNEFNGGALALPLSAVPEPSTWGLLVMAASLAGTWRFAAHS